MRWNSANCSTDELSDPVGPELNEFTLEERRDSTLFLKAGASEEKIHVNVCLSRSKENCLLLLNTS